ncbi:putative Histidine kinase [Acidobacteriia bacterium SbA2]|nr:putative Histidine kinase [Acidobacteriia bacterium SbA2]
MFRKPQSKSVFLASDFDSFKGQETTFIILNLFILATLLLVHTLFADYWGFPSVSLIAILAVALFAQGGELFWLASRSAPLGLTGMTMLSWASICFYILLAILLGAVTNREDTQYFIILIVPILVAAFRLTLPPTLAVVAVVDCINFFWVWHYAHHQPRTPVNEYVETGTVSLIYTVVGVLVWLLVNRLYQKEARLSESLVNLERAKERLLQEEKLAAVGRLASGIAHEIRNPVSTIVSALSTARGSKLAASEREEMFEIAAKESGRLERLTTDFLAYARPRSPQKTLASLDDTLGYVADVCRPRANERGVSIHAHSFDGLVAEIDASYVQQALVNLVMNAVEASPPEGQVDLRAGVNSDSSLRIEVENAGSCIPPASVARIFEPFFTTKAQGTGLGLAIARNVAHAHGGDLVLSANEPDRVCFTLTFPAARKNSHPT